MNRPLFIIIGSVTVLILLLVWVYILFIKDNVTDNNTGTSETFTNLDLGDTSLDSDGLNTDQENSSTSTNENGVERKKLRQLTTKQVAGFAEINSTSSDSAYFIEAGVGHIYEIDIFTGQEKRISATTFPDTYGGDVSSNGKYFAIQTGYNNSRSTYVGTIETASQSVSSKEIEKGVVSYSFFDDNTLGYAVLGTQNIEVKTYNFKTSESKSIFKIPFREASIVWGKETTGPHYFFPKSAEGLEGFVYEYENGVIQRLPLDGFSLSAYGSQATVIATYEDNSKYQTSMYNQSDGAVSLLTTKLLPSKCIETRDAILICGIDKTVTLDQTYLTRWQQGLVRSTDDLYAVDVVSSTLSELANTKEITGRIADMTKLEQGIKHGFVYFINKNDRTLWIYEHEMTTPSTSNVE